MKLKLNSAVLDNNLEEYLFITITEVVLGVQLWGTGNKMVQW